MGDQEKRKRGRPRVDTSLTEDVYRDSRRQAVNQKYAYDGVGVLMDGGDRIPDSNLIYTLGDNETRTIMRNGILEQLGRMAKQDHASLDDCVFVAALSAAAVKSGAKTREIEKAIRVIRMARNQLASDPESLELSAVLGRAVKELRKLGHC